MIREYEVLKADMSAKLNIVKEHDYKWDYSKGMYENLNIFFNEVLKLSEEKIEHKYIVALDISNNVIGISHNNIGDHDGVSTDRKNMALFLHLSEARGFILIHNHPKTKGYGIEDSLKFSEDDISYNAAYLNYGQCSGIICIDSILISHGKYITSLNRLGN